MALLGLWLFWKRDAFSEPLSRDRIKERSERKKQAMNEVTHLEKIEDSTEESLEGTSEETKLLEAPIEVGPVSYTHLDVYKRQPLKSASMR